MAAVTAVSKLSRYTIRTAQVSMVRFVTSLSDNDKKNLIGTTEKSQRRKEAKAIREFQ